MMGDLAGSGLADVYDGCAEKTLRRELWVIHFSLRLRAFRDPFEPPGSVGLPMRLSVPGGRCWRRRSESVRREEADSTASSLDGPISSSTSSSSDWRLKEACHISSSTQSWPSASTETSGEPIESERHSGLHIQLGINCSLSSGVR